MQRLRSDVPPNGQRPVVGVLDSQEVVMSAALVRVMAFRQEQERPLRGLGVFLRRVAAQPLEALPVNRLFGLLLALLAARLQPDARSCMCSVITPMRAAVASMRRRITCLRSPLALRSSLLACFITRSQCATALASVSVPSCSRPR